MRQATRIAIGLGIALVLLVCVFVGLLLNESPKGPVKVNPLNPLKSPTVVTDYKDKREIVCWGDSLTEGIGASSAFIRRETGLFNASFLSYPEILELLTGIRTYNFGVSGATSAEIAYMQGGWVLESDIEDELKEREIIREDIMELGAQHPGDILVIEMGSNGGWEEGYEQLIAQYHAMIDHAGCANYIIVGDTDDPGSSYADPYGWVQDYGLGIEETAWEVALREEFGEHFINMRLFLIEHGLEVCGLAPTVEDEASAMLGWVSEQLRSDWTHLNSYGYYAQAVGVYEKGKELGYWA